MAAFTVWYCKPASLPAALLGTACGRKPPVPRVSTLAETHTELGRFEARDLEDLFVRMQGEVWSPNGEARPLIQSKGLAHTSMSVGDVAVRNDGAAFMCAWAGWLQLDA